MSTNDGVQPPPQSSTETHKRYGAAEGRDIALISSDGVAFHVESMYLAVGSHVWRDMLAVGRPNESQDAVKEVTLTDNDIENSGALVILLDLFHSLPLALPSIPRTNGIGRVNLEMTIQLARKYECSSALNTLHHAIRDWVSFGDSPEMVFILAAALNDIEACSMLIRLHGAEETGDQDEEDPDPDLDCDIPGHRFEIATWPAWMAERVPFRYMFALMRAERKVKPVTGTTPAVRWESISKRFRELLMMDD